MHQGKYSEAFDLYERVANGRLANLGEKNPGTLDSFNNLAVVWSVLRKLRVYSDGTSINSRFTDSSREKRVVLKDLYSKLHSSRVEHRCPSS